MLYKRQERITKKMVVIICDAIKFHKFNSGTTFLHCRVKSCSGKCLETTFHMTKLLVS